jgi:hypothetical protein
MMVLQSFVVLWVAAAVAFFVFLLVLALALCKAAAR